ncbi:MAG: thiazole biosynthesis adenylyltransferase ThiF [Clostridia bacterium]|nr:MAG: thiazole biosynthesis adenylyltransferase ThiF [Clostridia bacterium]
MPQPSTSSDLSRYQRQMIFRGLGEEGQRKLAAGRIAIVGCGATGSALANLLARAGVGFLRLIDRDFVELSNLHRQMLYTEADIGQPKAVAAARRIGAINSAIQIEARVRDFNPGNALALLDDVDFILDGTDNFETRYLINDAALKLGLPWVYTGVVASYGLTATLIPEGAAGRTGREATPCLQCILGPEPPAGGPTCDTAGVIGPIVTLMASISASEAIKVLTGKGEINRGMIMIDLWDNSFESFGVAARNPDCPACGHGAYRFLDAEVGSRTAVLCGRNAVQISNPGARISLPVVARRLQPLGKVEVNEYLLRAHIDEYELTLFADARAIIKGTEDIEKARSLYARYVGV